MADENEVLLFINKFKSSNPSAMEEAFTRGNCYWFAYILKQRFVEGDLMYHPIDGHFAYRYKNRIYDITGETNRLGFVSWNTYRRSELWQAKLIKRACIRLEE